MRCMHVSFAMHRYMSPSSITTNIVFPSKVDDVMICGVYLLMLVDISTGEGLEQFASVSTSGALRAASKWTMLSQFLSAADIECLNTKSVLIGVVVAYFPLVKVRLGFGTAGSNLPVVEGGDGDLLIIGLIIGVAVPK